jgi:hypothetical protein
MKTRGRKQERQFLLIRSQRSGSRESAPTETWHTKNEAAAGIFFFSSGKDIQAVTSVLLLLMFLCKSFLWGYFFSLLILMFCVTQGMNTK